jgi:hypothetical protein
MQYNIIENMEFHDFVVLFGITWVFVGLLVKVITSNKHVEFDDNDDNIDIDNIETDTDSDNNANSYDSYNSDSTLVNTGSHVNSVQEFSETELDTIHYNSENEN